MLLLSIFALESEKQSKKDERTLFWDSLQRLDLSLKLYFKNKKNKTNWLIWDHLGVLLYLI